MRAGMLRRLMNLWPPFLFSGIRVTHLADDWREAEVEMRLRWYNRNWVGVHFGGSLFAMTDPFYMLLLIHLLGPDHVVWDKAAAIDFVRPGRGRVRALSGRRRPARLDSRRHRRRLGASASATGRRPGRRRQGGRPPRAHPPHPPETAPRRLTRTRPSPRKCDEPAWERGALPYGLVSSPPPIRRRTRMRKRPSRMSQRLSRKASRVEAALDEADGLAICPVTSLFSGREATKAAGVV